MRHLLGETDGGVIDIDGGGGQCLSVQDRQYEYCTERV